MSHFFHSMTVTDSMSSPSIYLSAQQMNSLAQSPRSIALGILSSTSHGLLLHSSQLTGIASMTPVKSLLMPMPFNTFSHMKANPLSGALFRSLKGYRQHGRRNANHQNMHHTTQLSLMRSTRSRSTTVSSMRKMSMSYPLVSSMYMHM